MTTTLLGKLLAAIQNVINKIEHKLPTILENAAIFGLKYVNEAIAALNSNAASDLTALVPDTEPLKAEILVILGELKAGLQSVQGAYQSGVAHVAAAKIGQLQVGTDVPLEHMQLAVAMQSSANSLAAAGQ